MKFYRFFSVKITNNNVFYYYGWTQFNFFFYKFEMIMYRVCLNRMKEWTKFFPEYPGLF